ncbi:MAG: HAMP domain-containing sensor histidine kinase [Patescibacteria group bacterium]|nr:HAMP domain-containing sensor histidine kinase [Patescibacteria group bacterium]
MTIVSKKNEPATKATEVNENHNYKVASLEEERRFLQEQRLAIFNVLEDVNEVQVELKRKYQESGIVHDLIEKISNTLEPKDIFYYIVQSIKVIFNDRQIAWTFAPVGVFSGKQKIFFILSEPVGKTYCQKLCLDIEKEIKDKKIVDKSGFVYPENNEQFEYEIIEGISDESNPKEPLAEKNFFVLVPATFYGLINISSVGEQALSKQDVETINYIISSATETVARLKVLVASEQSRVGDLVENLNSSILMFDINKMILNVNRSMREVLMNNEAQTNLNSLNNLFKLSDSNSTKALSLNEAIDSMISTSQSIKIEEVFYDGKYYELYIGPLKDFRGNLSGGILALYDITRLKEIDKMKTDFVSIASHQLRTPLTGIKLMAETLADKEVGQLNEAQSSYLKDLYNSTLIMIKLVNDLLNVSRIESGRLKVEPILTDLPTLVAALVNEAQIVARSDCKIVFVCQPDDFKPIMLDSGLIRQAINNLISNAQRYSPDRECQITVSLKKEGDNYLLSVKDEGIGIESTEGVRVFEKFFRIDRAVKKESEGTGLGLYVAKMIVELSGGSIWFQSDGKDKGTEFFVKIPMTGMQKKEGKVGLEK